MMAGERNIAPLSDNIDFAPEVVPTHVAIIMDGNGRWAARRGLPRIEGHRRGIEAVRRAVRSAGELGVKYLTLYSFSSENWRRPAQEVADLMGLLKRFIRHDLAELHASGVKVRIIGDRNGLASDIRSLIEEAGAIAPVLAAGKVAVLAPSRWLRAADTLPHSWDVTSDSVAAFVAGALDAARLDLVKPADVGWEGVDRCFAAVVPAGLEVRVVGWERFVEETLAASG